MLRVVSGRLRGRRLVAPKGQGTRPTSDRIREAIFNILTHGPCAQPFEGLRVLDVFAGTGALGIEAISRGAGYAVFMETDAAARALIRENVEALGLMGETKIFRRDATNPGPVSALAPFDLCLLDPPYSKGLGERAVTALAKGGWLTEDAIVVLEEKAGVDLVCPAGFVPIEVRAWGETQVAFWRFTATPV
ncbi:MAG: 16S rRNA (guanine(966)-N(2))-methyltransferase RsmD [Pseudomonadota bacterium]